jgi:2-polyprenyl-6-hydroxyphenyl methylase/3-demethylubiquinone-9 3-methyltransferase
MNMRPLIIPFDLIEEYVPKNGFVVDVGCGYGIFANYLATSSKEREIIGIDLNKKRISTANKIFAQSPNLNFMHADITGAKIPNADIITAIDVLHHIPTLELQTQLLKSCFSVLSKNGKLIVKDVDTKPKWKHLIARFNDYVMAHGDLVLFQDKHSVTNLLKKTGFEIEKIVNIKKYPYAHILYIAKKMNRIYSAATC